MAVGEGEGTGTPPARFLTPHRGLAAILYGFGDWTDRTLTRAIVDRRVAHNPTDARNRDREVTEDPAGLATRVSGSVRRTRHRHSRLSGRESWTVNGVRGAAAVGDVRAGMVGR